MVLPEECPQAPDHLDGTLAGTDDVVEHRGYVLTPAPRRGDESPGRLGAGDDRRQRLAQLVRQGGDQLAQGGQPQGVRQGLALGAGLRLGAPPGGDVDVGDDRPALGTPERFDHHLEPALLGGAGARILDRRPPGATREDVLEGGQGPPGSGIIGGLSADGEIVGADRGPGRIGAAVRHRRRPRLVDRDDDAGGVDGRHPPVERAEDRTPQRRALEERLVSFPQLGHVDAGPDVPDERALAGEARRSGGDDPAVLPVGPAETVLDTEVPPGAGRVPVRGKACRPIGGMQELRPPVAQVAAERSSGEAERLLVEERHASLGVRRPHADRRLVGQRPEALLALAKRLVRLPPRQRVAEDLGERIQLLDELGGPLALAGGGAQTQGADHRPPDDQRHGREGARADGDEAPPVDRRLLGQIVRPHEGHRLAAEKALDHPREALDLEGVRHGGDARTQAAVGELHEALIGGDLGQRGPFHVQHVERLAQRRLDLRPHLPRPQAREGRPQVGEEPLEAQANFERGLGLPPAPALGEERDDEQSMQGDQDPRAHGLFWSRCWRLPASDGLLAPLTVGASTGRGYGPKVLVRSHCRPPARSRGSRRSLLTQRPLSNKLLLGAVALTLGLQRAASYVPAPSRVFKIEPT